MVVRISEPPVAKLVLADTRLGWLWLVVRLYVGYEWLSAGVEKVTSAVWTGDQAGKALQGFVTGALTKSQGAHPDVSGWYATFLHDVVIQHAALFSYMVAWGEVAVGVALIVGIFTGIAAFFGAFMNMNYLLAGTVSINPVLFIGQLGLILAWRIAGWIGADRWVLPLIGTPWQREVEKE